MTRDEYYRQLFNVSAYSTWSAWLVYFLKGIAPQAKDTLRRAEHINHLLADVADGSSKVAELPSAVPTKIIRCLAATPFLSVHKIAVQLGVAFTTAQRAVQKLESLG